MRMNLNELRRWYQDYMVEYHLTKGMMADAVGICRPTFTSFINGNNVLHATWIKLNEFMEKSKDIDPYKIHSEGAEKES